MLKIVDRYPTELYYDIAKCYCRYNRATKRRCRMEKLIRSRNKKENHITINIKGPEAITIGNAIRKALREMECRKEISYNITMKDSPQ
nr:MAG TPA: RNA polymerase-like protein [Caudoviricetes sp.]